MRGSLANDVASHHREALDWQQELNVFINLGKRISSESDILQSRKIFEGFELAEKRWKNIVKDLTNKMNENSINNNDMTDVSKNLNDAVSWAETTLSLITSQVNVSVKDDLEGIIEKLQRAQADAINQRVVLDEFASQVGVNNDAYQQARGKIERIAQMLPKRLGFLVERKNKLIDLSEKARLCEDFVENMKLRRQSLVSAQDGVKIRLLVSDKEYEMNKLFKEFLLLEREVTGAGANLEPNLSQKMKTLKDNWYSLLSDVRRTSNNVNGNGVAVTSPSRLVPVDSISSPAESMLSLGSPSTTSTSQDMIASPTPTPTTQSTSPMSEELISMTASTNENAQNNLIAKCKKVVGWLNNLGKHTDFLKSNTKGCLQEILYNCKRTLSCSSIEILNI